MGAVRRWRSRWRNRRWELARGALEGRERDGDLNPGLTGTDSITGDHYAGQRALSRFLNPKAKTKTEWRGD